MLSPHWLAPNQFGGVNLGATRQLGGWLVLTLLSPNSFCGFLSKVESEMTDSVSSEFHDFYEDTVRDSLTSILHKAFGILCREPAEGFSRSFKKRDNLGNLL